MDVKVATDVLSEKWLEYHARVSDGFKLTTDEAGLMKGAFTAGFGYGMEYALQEVMRRTGGDKPQSGFTED